MKGSFVKSDIDIEVRKPQAKGNSVEEVRNTQAQSLLNDLDPTNSLIPYYWSSERQKNTLLLSGHQTCDNLFQ